MTAYTIQGVDTEGILYYKGGKSGIIDEEPTTEHGARPPKALCI